MWIYLGSKKLVHRKNCWVIGIPLHLKNTGENNLMDLIELAFFTDKINEMVSFYKHLLGSEPVAQSEGMAIFMVGSTKIFIHQNYTPSEGELPPVNHIAFAVDDVDLTCQGLVQQGLRMEVPPQDYYWGRSAYLRDPEGHQIELTQGGSGDGH
jgi:catechol 2,3-dioxygenase-like lactoylglutathione lyase family enzyme